MYEIYLTPHSHYDVVWVFTKEQYLEINERILEKAIELIKRGDYAFLIEQTYLLEAIEKSNPELWTEICKAIKYGRIEVVDGMYVMPDLMLPNGETIVRNIVEGKRYCKDKFGIEIPTGWAADNFGLNAQTPQIYRKSGYRWLSLRRGVLRAKPSEFIWRGLDGSELLTHWMPLGYRSGLDFRRFEENFHRLSKLAAGRHILMPCGSGGTIPLEETSEFVRQWNNTHEDSKIHLTTPKSFFEAIEKSGRIFSAFRGELYSDNISDVFPGVLSSRMWVKQGFRKCENLILTAERFACIAWLLGGEYPELRELWKKLIYLSFHDILPGTCVDEVYDEVGRYIEEIEREASEVLRRALEVIGAASGGDGVVVFNPNPWDVHDWVEVELRFEEGKVRNAGLDVRYERLEEERYRDGSVRRVRLGFVADVPSLGYRVYRVIIGGQAIEEEYGGKEGVMEIENEFFKVEASDEGLIRVYENGKEILSGNEIVIEDESGDLYHHRDSLGKPIKTESGEGFRFGDFKTKKFETEWGKVRRRIVIEKEFYCLRWPYRLLDRYKPEIYKDGTIEVRKEVILYGGIPRIEFRTRITNRHPGVRIRVRFEVPVDVTAHAAETQFGVIRRANTKIFVKNEHWEEKYAGVLPALNWIDYSDGEKGITVINEGIPAYEIRKRRIYLTLLRSVMKLSDGMIGPVIPTHDALELRDYEYRYALYPHRGKVKEPDSLRQAYQHNLRLIAMQMQVKGRVEVGEKERSKSFVSIEPENLVLTALKPAEDGNGVIIRFFEVEGNHTNAEIRFFREPRKVMRTDLLEREEEEGEGGEVRIEEGKIKLGVKPFEIVTLKMSF